MPIGHIFYVISTFCCRRKEVNHIPACQQIEKRHTMRIPFVFIATMLLCRSVEGRKSIKSLFTHLLTHSTTKKAPTVRPKNTFLNANEKVFADQQGSHHYLGPRFIHQHPSHDISTKDSAPTVTINPNTTDSDSTRSNSGRSTPRFERGNASILSKHFRAVPLLFLLHLVIRAGIAEASKQNTAHLYRICILHMAYGLFLVVAKRPSPGLIIVLQFLVSTLSLLTHLEGVVLQLMVYGSISVWLVLLLCDKSNDASLFLQGRLPVGLAIGAAALMCVAPNEIDLESTKLLPGLLVILLYFDLLGRLVFPSAEFSHDEPNGATILAGTQAVVDGGSS